MKEAFNYSESPTIVSKIANQFNSMINTETTKKLQATNITDWLVQKNFLYIEEDQNGKKRKLPTEYGEEIGLSWEKRYGMYGSYTVVLYDIDAQHFVVDHLEDIVESNLK